MSQNPATSHRRALAPPAVTRFQLRTASASEAVFAPPFVAPHPVSVRYAARRPAPVSYDRAPTLERGQYTAPRSIHAPEPDSWPVAAPEAGDTPELELFDVIEEHEPERLEAASDEPYLERTDSPRDPAFPLDAFIVPTGVAQPPAGYAEAQAAQLADRLEELARQIREHGIGAIGNGEHPEQLARVLGAIMAGYLARDS